jgi:HSP20 family protein
MAALCVLATGQGGPLVTLEDIMESRLPRSSASNTPAETQKDPFSMLRQEINDLFSSFSNFPSRSWASQMSPRLDVSETDQELDIDAELPGVDEKDIEITLAGDTLTIRGERKNGQEEKKKNYHVSEGRWGSFTRSVTLPFDADPSDIDARFEKGVLHIAIKKPPSVTAKTARIPIKNA